MRFVDFFAGIGGASLGLQNAGFKLIDAIEVDGEAKSVYRKNLGLLPKGDIMNVPTNNLNGKADLFYASFPFKEMSKTFNSFVQEDPDDFVNSNLYFYFFDFVAYHKPKYLILEIIKNITKAGERHLNVMYKILSQLGYNTSTFCLNYREYGLPIFKEVVYLISTPSWEPRFELNMPPNQMVSLADFFKTQRFNRKQVINTGRYQILDLPFDSPRSIYYKGYIKGKKTEDQKQFSRTFPYNQRIYSDLGFFPCFQLCEDQFRYFVYQEKKRRVIKLNDANCYAMKGFPSDFKLAQSQAKRCSQLAYSSSPIVTEWIASQLELHASIASESLLVGHL